MRRAPLRSATALAAISLISVIGLAEPALAKTAPDAPAAAPVLLDCFGDFGDPTIPNLTEPDVAVNYAGEAGCVGIRSTGDSLQLAWVILADGWSYEVVSDGAGTNSRVHLKFTAAATNQNVDFRYEFGKTVIR
jgi:hypothetical protein